MLIAAFVTVNTGNSPNVHNKRMDKWVVLHFYNGIVYREESEWTAIACSKIYKKKSEDYIEYNLIYIVKKQANLSNYFLGMRT